MSWLALAVDWTGQVPPVERVRAMSAIRRGHAPDGVDEARLPRAAAALGRRAVTARDRAVACEVDEAASLLAVGDVRLFNRRALADELGRRESDVSDLGLVRLGYERWSTEVAKHLVGSFAFAIWDGRAGRVVAARDHLGLRPLHYRTTGDQILVATDVSQILAATPARLPLRADRVLDFLLGEVSRHGRTFFEGVELLKPGHTLVATSSGSSEHRYWFPPSADLPFGSDGEVREEVARLFRQVVREHLESDHPIVAHMSGGFDSTTILTVADEIHEAEPERPELLMASATMPGFDCDETPLMDAVARAVRFRGVRWPAVVACDDDLEAPLLSAPGLRAGIVGGPPRDLELARELGARVLVAGSGGDEVVYAHGVFREILRRGQWPTLIRETLLAFPPRQGLRHLRDALEGVVPGASRLRRWRSGQEPPPPVWLGPRLRATDAGKAEEPISFTSHLREGVWRALTAPKFAAYIDIHNAYTASAGVELRLPYTDVRLLELVMGIPLRFRLPNGRMRGLQQESLAGLIPPEVMSRPRRVWFDPVWAQNLRLLLPKIREILWEGEWLSAPFVDRAQAQALFLTEDAKAVGGDWSGLRGLGALAKLEAWTRGLARYYSSREVFDGPDIRR